MDVSLLTLQTDLDDARRELRNLIVFGMAPALSREKVTLVRDLERSARAEVKLRIMALEYRKGQVKPK